MAKQATKDLTSEIISLRKSQKELQAENKKLKLSNAAYKNNNAKLKEDVAYSKADYKRIFEDYKVDTDSLKSQLHEAKSDLSSTDRKLNKRNNEMLELRRLLNVNLSPSVETKSALVELIEFKELLQKENALYNSNLDQINNTVKTLREENEALKKDNKALKENYDAIHTDYKVDTKKQSDTIKSLQNELQKTLSAVDIDDFFQSEKNFKCELSKLLSLPETASMADILNALVSLRLKYEEALGNGSDVKRQLGLTSDAKAMDILNAIDFLKHKYQPSAENLFKQVCKLFDKNIFTTSVDDLMRLIKTNYEYAHSPFYMEVCDILKQHHGTKPEMLLLIIRNLLIIKSDYTDYIGKNRKLLVDLERSEKANKEWETIMKSVIGADGPYSVAQAIKNLQADLEAARDQEDKNAREVDRLKKLNLELQAHINELGKPENKLSKDFTSIKDIIDEVVKNATKQIFKECSNENFNSNDKQTKLEQELREKNDELINKCNELNFENTQLKNTIDSIAIAAKR